MKPILIIILFNLFLFNIHSQETKDKTELDKQSINFDSIQNIKVKKQIKKRVKKIINLNKIITVYSPVIDSAISTDCINVKSTVLNIITNKWKELLFDKNELEKVNNLKALNEEDISLNEKIDDLIKEISLLKAELSIEINTKLNLQNNKTINSVLMTFETNFYRFDKINQSCLSILN